MINKILFLLIILHILCGCKKETAEPTRKGRVNDVEQRLLGKWKGRLFTEYRVQLDWSNVNDTIFTIYDTTMTVFPVSFTVRFTDSAVSHATSYPDIAIEKYMEDTVFNYINDPWTGGHFLQQAYWWADSNILSFDDHTINPPRWQILQLGADSLELYQHDTMVSQYYHWGMTDRRRKLYLTKENQ